MPNRQLVISQLTRLQDHWPSMPATEGVVEDYVRDPFVSQLADREFVTAISHVIGEWKGFTHPHLGDVKDAARLLAKRSTPYYAGDPDDARKCLACDTTTLIDRGGRLVPDHKPGCGALQHVPLSLSPRRGGLGSLGDAIAAERAAREHAHAE